MRWVKLACCLIVIAAAMLFGVLAQGAESALSGPSITSGPPVWSQATTADFTFTSPDAGVSFECRLDDRSPEPCSSPWSYSSLSQGDHIFQVNAILGDEASPSSWQWTVDFSPPSIPDRLSVEATSPVGTPVTFTATDNLDPSPLLSCAPASASAFPVGPTDVTCTATDAAGNSSGEGVFTVTVSDTTPPVLSPHRDVIVTQKSAAGASVNYRPPAVTDNGDAAPVVNCSPSPGSTFPIGTTPVSCLAVDASDNSSSPVKFNIIVQQGQIPAAPTVDSDVGALTRQTTADFTFSFPAGLSAECRLGSSADPGSFARCETSSSQTYAGLTDGGYLFTLRVRNSIGNVNEATHSWSVDTTPPIDVLGLRTRFGNGWIKLAWTKPTDIDYSHVIIRRRRVGSTTWKLLGTRSATSTFLNQPVRNDVRYVYAVKSVDSAGNRSRAATVAGRASRILRPRFGAALGSPPLVDWTRVRNATYYNMQVWRGGRKILSVWPSKSAYQLHQTWRFGGKRYSFQLGRYFVYVWPGFRARSAVDYGPLLGWTSFTVG